MFSVELSQSGSEPRRVLMLSHFPEISEEIKAKIDRIPLCVEKAELQAIVRRLKELVVGYSYAPSESRDYGNRFWHAMLTRAITPASDASDPRPVSDMKDWLVATLEWGFQVDAGSLSGQFSLISLPPAMSPTVVCESLRELARIWCSTVAEGSEAEEMLLQRLINVKRLTSPQGLYASLHVLQELDSQGADTSLQRSLIELQVKHLDKGDGHALAWASVVWESEAPFHRFLQAADE